jgi:hypothetical protein
MASESPEQLAWRKEFENLPIAQVLSIAEHDPAKFKQDQKSLFAKSWLAERAETREDDAIAIARDANTIALAAASSASDANDIARSAKKYALIAAIAAIIAAVAAIKWR